ELDFVQSQFSGDGGGKAVSFDLQAVEKMMKHLEVDRQELGSRCERLVAEKKELSDAKDDLEAELYKAKRELDDAKRQLQHQGLDQRLRGGPEVLPQEEVGGDDEATLESLEVLQQMSGTQRQAAAMTKLQLARALRCSQDELASEQLRSEKLARRLRKDRERLQILEDTADRQRQEITFIRKKTQTKMAGRPEVVAERTKMLHYLEHTLPVNREIPLGPSPFGEVTEGQGIDHPLALPEGVEGHPLSRSISAPNRLPKMRGRFVPI
ncbi:unnamed protein product, partial [Polarella glacialis]